MLIIRFWLEQLFKCAFKDAYFYRIVFNPQMINLLFDNDKTIPIQFNIQEPYVVFRNNTFDNFLKFTLNHLANSTNLLLNFGLVNNLEQYTNILFDILIEGNKFSRVSFYWSKLARLHDLVVEYIATSENCSKMVPIIMINYFPHPKSKLNKSAEKVEVDKESKIIKYEIANIHNPKKIKKCLILYQLKFNLTS
uniref:Uncharacterized protein n=1 Tax=Meloidogyne enterolobii TaxID=390850 RepID=A0A6V7UK40_MELEN|nr:unnamed protein product [Meloidogyne enterolobii]